VFSDRFEAVCVRNEWSTAEAARELEVSRTTIYDIKNRKIPVSDKMWRKLGELERRSGLGVSDVISEKTSEPCPAAPPANLDAMAQMQANMAELAAGLAELTREVRSLRLEVSASSRTVAGGGIKLDVGRSTPTDPQQRAAS
jgi:DNA-binding XRE family transcriptional regulator